MGTDVCFNGGRGCGRIWRESSIIRKTFISDSIYIVSNAQLRQDMFADIALEITNIVEKHSQVDWTDNKSIHDKIAQDIDDMFYEYKCEGKCKFSFDVIDKVIENVKTTALRRFKG